MAATLVQLNESEALYKCDEGHVFAIPVEDDEPVPVVGCVYEFHNTAGT
jgi:hypothetical protein